MIRALLTVVVAHGHVPSADSELFREHLHVWELLEELWRGFLWPQSSPEVCPGGSGLPRRFRVAGLSVSSPRGCLGRVPGHGEAAGEGAWLGTYGGAAATASHPLPQAVRSAPNRWEKSRHKLEYLGKLRWEQLLLMSAGRANLGGGHFVPGSV